MNWWLNLPAAAQWLLLAAVGAVVGSAVNFAAYGLLYDRRPVSPWLPLSTGQPQRAWLARLPIAGWLLLSRESAQFGPWHWLRPLAVEFAFAALVPALYLWEVVDRMLLLRLMRFPGNLPDGFLGEPDVTLALHAMFACHVILIALMLAASLIDMDERLIPDGITVPGTLLGLATAAIYPWTRLPASEGFDAAGRSLIDFLKVTSPIAMNWPEMLSARPSAAGLAIGLACYWLWIIGLMPRPWRTRRGYAVALRLLSVRFRQGITLPLVTIALTGTAGIVWSWYASGVNWIGLASALIGMAVGGGMVWIVRVLGFVMLRREAMGFGDVTLMAMIGSFVGWQPCLLIFFIAPVFALAFGVVQILVSRDNEIYYGPFLCLATFAVIVRWRDVWEWARPMFDLGWLVPAAMGLALVAMIIMLGTIRIVKRAFS